MIFVTGDLHGAEEIWKLKKKAFPLGRRLTKDDFVVILGDVGLVWYPTKPATRGLWDQNPPVDRLTEQEKFWLGFLSEQPWTTLFLDGNHENFDRLLAYPVQDFHSGKASKIHDTVWYLRRGEVFDLCGKKCFVMGGAASIDKQWREPGRTWWPQEVPSQADLRNAERNLEKHDCTVDLVFTHTCPETIKKQLPLIGHMGNVAEKIDFVDPTEGMLDGIAAYLRFEKWYFAHFHLDHEVANTPFISVYNKVLRV